MTNNANDLANDAPLDPAAMLDIASRQSYRMQTLELKSVVAILFSWGIAWGVGFLVLWAGLDAGAPFAVAQPAASIVFGVLIAAAIVVSMVLGIRMSRGMRGSSNVAGAIYGWSWSLGSIAAWLIGSSLVRAGMQPDVAILYFPAVYSLVVGLLYLAGAAIWQSKLQLVLGIWMIVVGTIAPIFGYPWNLPIMAALGGGGFIVGAIIMLVSLRKGARRG
jgi:hypothetical protein